MRILDEAVVEAVRLSSRYIPARQLPDKSRRACSTPPARASRSASRRCPADDRGPAPAASRRLEREQRILEREAAIGGDHAERLARGDAPSARRAKRGARGARSSAGSRRSELVARDPRRCARSSRAARRDATRRRRRRRRERETCAPSTSAKRAELARAAGRAPLVLPEVDAQAVAEVISGWTGIPVGKMVADEIHTRAAARRQRSGERVIGQDHALEAIARRIRTARAQARRPVAADRRVPARRPERRRQDRDRARARRHALRRRAQLGHHQHVGVPGGAHRLEPEGLAARLRRLRRGRRADRGRAPQPYSWCCSTRSRRRTPT